jgi:hypothetical protein
VQVTSDLHTGIEDSLTADVDGGQNDALLTLLCKLEKTLIAENDALQSGRSEGNSEFILQKNRFLKELFSLRSAVHSGSLKAILANKISEVRLLIRKNHDLLAADINAMNDLTT